MLQEAYMYMEELLAATNGQVGARVEFKERSGRCHATLIDQVSGEDVGAMLLAPILKETQLTDLKCAAAPVACLSAPC